MKGGGYDLLPGTLRLIQNGSLQFTIDQQPYLQGFYPVVQLFLYKLSGGLVAPSDTNTGLLFVTKAKRQAVPDHEDPLPRELEGSTSTRSPGNTWLSQRQR